ncbi:inhibitor of growth protein 2-like [Oppia nitens]|uniref:inhibitor of growth protein 2-like n=1 Tax=Oppia nitens TaxID=1686743 RepID=UPI0023DB5713|nr:inhibitor of growth protein 2-like [Oppia nitens]
MWSSSQYVLSDRTSMSESPLQSIVQYIEDYMDLVENIPNDIARQMTQLHEHNHRYHQLLQHLDTNLHLISNKTTNDIRKRKSLIKLQRCLIDIQEIADEKLLLIQSILDQLDCKARQLDYDFRSVTLYNSQTNQTNNSRLQIQNTNALPVTTNCSSAQRSDSTSSSSNGNNNSNNTNNNNNNNNNNNTNNNNNNTNNSSNDSQTKDMPNGNSNGHQNDNSSASKRASARRNNNSRNNHDKDNDDRSAKRSVKRGMKVTNKDMKRSRNSLNSSSSSLLMGDSSPPLYEGAPIDPDEPTYCLCDQVSFGEMICCDNSDCKIEWFHFQCVSLNTKPKGKWFCPNCRGDRSNIQKK